VEADDFGKLTFVEVAADGVPDFIVEVRDRAHGVISSKRW